MDQPCLDDGFALAIKWAEKYADAEMYPEAAAAFLSASTLAGLMTACAPPDDTERYEKMGTDALRRAREYKEKPVAGCEELADENGSLRGSLGRLARQTGNGDMAEGLLSGKNVADLAEQLTKKAVGWYSAPSAPAPAAAAASEDECPTAAELRTPKDTKNALTFEDIVGLDEAKERFVRMVVNPLKYPDWSAEQRIRPFNALLYGPGGTGKTTIIEAGAKVTDTPLFIGDAATIKGKFVGQSEKCFKVLVEAATAEGSDGIIFLDEVDGLLAGDGDIEKAFQSQFKTLIQPGKPDQPVLTAATNRPWDITDDAIQRRFELKLYISLPTPGQRRWYLGQILAKRLCDTCTGKPLDLEDIIGESQWAELLDATRGFTPADLDALFSSARSKKDVSLFNIENVAFVPSTIHGGGKLDAVAKGTAGAGALTADRLTDKQRRDVCWPMVTFGDFEAVLKQALVRATVSKDSLTEFRDYAVKVQDTKSIPEIDRTIREIEGKDPIDMAEVKRYMDGMFVEKAEWLKRVREKCRQA